MKYLQITITILINLSYSYQYRHFQFPDCTTDDECVATKITDWQLSIFQFLDKNVDNKINQEELSNAWNYSLPIKNNEPDIDKWKQNIQFHFCKLDPNNGCNFKEFATLLEEMFEVNLRNTMRNYIKALYKSLKIMVRQFYSAAETVGDGECAVKLKFSQFINLFRTLFECKKTEGDKEVDCVSDDYVKANIFDKYGNEDDPDSEDKCKITIDGDYKKYLTLEKFEEVVLNQKMHEIVTKAIDEAKIVKIE